MPGEPDATPPLQLDVDGVPRGQAVLDGLVKLLDLHPGAEPGIMVGAQEPIGARTRVFGGQVAAQALTAAGRSVEPDRHVHSLHGYFLRPGDATQPIDYAVERLRDGTSFSVRRVVASQARGPIFVMSASFQVLESGVEHALPAPTVPLPLELPTLPERVASAPGTPFIWNRVPRPFDIRYVTDPPWVTVGREVPAEARSQVWFRPDGIVPDDPLLQVCLLAYVSDLTLLDAVLLPHGLSHGDRMQIASIDHAMWFHRPVRMDDWILYDTTSPSASGARGLGSGHFFDASGALLATVVQEGLIRQR